MTISSISAAEWDALPLTGERTVPGIAHENYWFRRHEVAYQYALSWVRGADVLEAGAGEGYGAAVLATSARQVFALDYDLSAIEHVSRKYPQVSAIRGNLAALPVADAAVDAVVSLQTVEHLWNQPEFISECARVLRPAGTFLISTPNRLTFSPGLDKPLNPFHTRELTAAELDELLAPHFRVSRMLGVHHGPRLRRADKHFDGFVAAQLAEPPATWHPELRRAVTAVRASDFVVTEDKVDASLDLFAIAVKK
ncbi:class I SAM-dependent methyltransferase [Fodinicola feengrottensis]|uniref:Class I SAM-dependent methyltransferase n=1 Tax=Fodinicola feengrottensis TaxID=435914 RepID=A0ABN2H8L3_9ACTN